MNSTLFKDEKNAKQLAEIANKNGLETASLQNFVDGILQRMIFDGEALNINHIQQIGYLPEERGLYKKMKVGEQVLYLAQLKGLTKEEALKRIIDED